MMRIRVAGLSHPGNRPTNDDNYCIGSHVEQETLLSLGFSDDASFFQKHGLLAAIADGIGGYAGGNYASRTALTLLQAEFLREDRTGASRTQLVDCVERYLARTQALLSTALAAKPGHGRAGTTVAGIVLMPPDLLVVFHAGDSRVLRASGGFVRCLTVDHTPLGADIASGRVTAAEALRTESGLDLTRSMGADTRPEAEISSELSWQPGDRFLLCSDGLHGVGRGLSIREIQSILTSTNTIEALTESLVAKSVEKDGSDNATAVVVDIEDGGNIGG